MKSASTSVELVPLDLISEIEAAAEQERRTPAELVGEAVERYLAERRWFATDDVDAKVAQGLESLRRGEAFDGEAVMAELIKGIDALPGNR